MKSLTFGLAAVLLLMLALVVADGLQGGLFSPRTPTSEVATYPVADLVRSPSRSEGGSAAVDMGPLIDIITTTIAPGTWRVEGRPGGKTATGSITPFYANNSLIIRHTPEVQAQVRERLRQLRSLPPLRETERARP
jgi:hypothetical protein